MGIDYEIQVCFPATAVRAVIEALIEFSGESGQVTTIRFADGAAVNTPFTSRFKPGELTLTLAQKIALDTSILFPIGDDVMKEYAQWSDPRMRVYSGGGQPLLRVGCIYLDIELGHRYSLFSFQAATTYMSRLFENSPSIWRRFQELSASCGGSTPVLMRDDVLDCILLTKDGGLMPADFLGWCDAADERGDALASQQNPI